MWEKLTSKAGSMQGTWVSTVLRLGGGGTPGAGQQKPCPFPQSGAGAEAQFGSRETWQRGEERSGEQQAGPPRSPEMRGKFEGTDTGAEGSLSSVQPGRGRRLLPQGHECHVGRGFNSTGRSPQSAGKRRGPWRGAGPGPETSH